MKKNNSNIFIIVLFLLIGIIVLFFPKIYSFIENSKLPQVGGNDSKTTEQAKTIDQELLDSIHYPIMRNSIYDSNTYYSLDKFSIKDMSNNDILYNAFVDMYEGNIVNSDIQGDCTTLSKEFSKEYIELRIKNILGKNISYTLTDFYVPEDSNSNYKGNWTYDNSKYLYEGLCESKISDTKYYNLEEFIKAEYDKNDIVVYYYVGFAKVNGNNYTIYKDANMSSELKSGTFTTVEDLNNIFKSISTKDKNIYKYTFKDTLCSYNEYCLYEGKWVNEL